MSHISTIQKKEVNTMKRFSIWMIVFVASMGMVAPFAWSVDKPDFTDPDAVLKNMRDMLDECSNSRCRDCMVKCGYGIKTLKNFLKANPGGDPSILKQRWQPCFEAHRDADIKPSAGAEGKKAPKEKAKVAKARPTHDRSKFVVSGLQLGGDMNTQRSRFFYLQAYGFHKKTKAEHYDGILQKGKSSPGPDIIRNYKCLIREKPVYIHFEATGDGRIYMIQFEQKEDMEVDEVKAAMIKRYGKPSKQHGNYIYWGCDRGPQEGFCVKANVSARALTIWANDEDIKNAAYKAYRKNVLKVRGVKNGAKF
jgi:hypothetical protein